MNVSDRNVAGLRRIRSQRRRREGGEGNQDRSERGKKPPQTPTFLSSHVLLLPPLRGINGYNFRYVCKRS